MRHQCGTIHKNQGCHNTTEDNTTFHQHSANWAAYLDNGQLDVERVLVSHHVWARVQLLLSLGQPVHAGLVAVQEVLVVINVLLRVLDLFLSHKSPLMFSSSLFPLVHQTFDSFVSFFSTVHQTFNNFFLLFFSLFFFLPPTSAFCSCLNKHCEHTTAARIYTRYTITFSTKCITISQHEHLYQSVKTQWDYKLSRTARDNRFTNYNNLKSDFLKNKTKYDHSSYITFSTRPA